MVTIAMLSRPQSGTLRTTRVTIVTNVLATGVALAALVLGLVLLIRTLQGHGAAWLLLEVPLLAVAIGCADLALFGIRQRLLLRG